ncbi:MAG: double-strand break repair helicase AddA [Micavibrio sp.]|nr:double-strand break repair helicase AddA [Micavibrio sp.]
MTTNPLALHDQPDTQPDPNENQRRATNPQHDVWVAASAGSGKTTVLTNRVLRLLLPDPEGQWAGTEPHKVLCITFTKAAAALMAIRIQKRLGDWAMMEEKKLTEELQTLTGSHPTEQMITAARQLFSKVLDVPSGLAIMTIHAFCQSTLARFPIEAGLTPGFKVIEETHARDLLAKSVMSIIWDIECGKAPHLEKPFNQIALLTDFDNLKDTILGILDKAEELENFLTEYGKGETLRRSLLELMDLSPDTTEESLLEQFLTTRPKQDLLRTAKLLCESGSRNAAIGQGIADWFALPPTEQRQRINLYEQAFFTQARTLRTLYKKFDETYPAEYELILREADTIERLLKEIATLKQAEQTRDFLTLAHEAITRYKQEKRRHNALDFSDLIIKTRQLLEEKGQEWVHYKLDEGIDHILVDEAQDTNTHQWQIIQYLSAEFLSGWGKESKTPRSIFVVGDKKQSIFSFHGADPQAFTRMYDYFGQKSTQAKRTLDPVNLDISFRTTPPVLKLVDEVFSQHHLALQLGLSHNETLTHYSHRKGSSGLIELWDVLTTEKTSSKNPDATWSLPFSTERATEQSGQDNNLAFKIAHRIFAMIESGERLVSENRPIEPRDILVLVRTRTGSLVSDLIRQLKLRNIAVSGIDRMNLREQIAVEDCMALARFARLPEDDLSLACILKSPFIRLDEEAVMNLALNRKSNQSLWDKSRQTLDQNIITWLDKKIEQARRLSPFNFFDETLSCPCPKDPKGSARRSFATLLGPDCMDPLDEFLGFCLTAEQDGIYSLENLVTHLEKHDIQIKRQLEDTEKESGNQVRIMTAHAAKGLEAPIVFLPDTTSKPTGSKINKFLWARASNGKQIPLWAASRENTSPIYGDAREAIKDKDYEEYLRLLYVALTRPRDRLYICGKVGSNGLSEKSDKLSWYQLIQNAFNRLEIKETSSTIRCFESQQSSPINLRPEISRRDKTSVAPEWLYQPPPKESDPRHYIQPSMIGRNLDPSLSPLQNAEEHRFERGILTHRLFEFLPRIAPAQRKNAARKFLDKSSQTLPLNIRENILAEVMAILDDPIFSSVFGPDSLAEVSVTGEIGSGRILSGQIDRLVIEETRILIVDFKSNRPSPQNPDDIPKEYKDQLRAYKSAISNIYKNKPIHCALLWTDRAILMPIEI